MTKLYLWLCFLPWTFCNGLTRDPLSSHIPTTLVTIPTTSNESFLITDPDQTSSKFETSSVDVFSTTAMSSMEPFTTENTTDVTITDVTVEENSNETLPREDKLPHTTTTINNSKQSNLTTPEYDESTQCASVSNLRVESEKRPKTTITWDFEKNSAFPICLHFDAINSSSFNNENCSSRFCSKKILTKYSTALCPYQEYNVSIFPDCDSGRGNELSILYKTEPEEPSPPQNFRVFPKDASSLSLSWLPPENPNGPIDGYILIYSNDSTSYEELFNVTTKTTHFITGLEPGSSYNISLSAFNFLSNRTLKSPAVMDQVVMPEIPGSPENFCFVQITNTSVTITWDSPKNTSGDIVKYSLKWMDEIKDTNSSVRQYTISNLQPFTNYSIAVTAWMNGGEGPPSVLDIRTDVSAPEPPVNITIQSASSQALIVSWDEPLTKNGPIHGYIIVWKSEKDSNGNTTVSGATRNFLLILNPYTEYSIGISAYNINSKNESLISQEAWHNASTLVYFPSQPRDFIVFERQHSYLFIIWAPPEVPNGPIDGYCISWWEIDAVGNINNSTVNITEEYYYLNNLKPWTNYTVKVLAFNVNKIGENLIGPPSILHSRTLAKIPEPPTAVTVTILSPYSALVEWSVEDDIYPGPTNYTVGVWEDPEKCTNITRHLIRNYKEGLTSWNTNSSVIEDLKPHTVYLFQIVASTDAGSSSSNFSMKAVTHSDAPGPPEDFRIDCSGSSTSVRLQWKSPNERNGDITEYRINYASGTNQLPKIKVITTEPESACEKIQHSTKIVNLRPEINYRFAIQAKTLGVNRYGPSIKYSEKCILPAGIPPIPENSSSLEAQNLGQEEATIVWSQDIFSSKMGRIVSYSIIVAHPEYIGLPRNGSLSRAGTLPTWSEFWEQQTNSYQATPTQWNPFTENTYDPLNCQKFFNSSNEYLLCTIGWEKNCTLYSDNYCNGRLKPGKQYGLKIRGFTHGGFSETHPLIIITAPPDQEKSYIALPIGLVCAFLLVASAFGCYYFLARRKATKGPIMNEIMVLFRKPPIRCTEPTIAMTSAAIETIQIEAKPPRFMNFSTFLKHVKIMSSDSNLKFSLEYEELKQNSPRHPCTAAALEENRPKNRWMNIFPFDHSRVKLLPIDDEPGSDYINASYIPGFSSHREYIASQGPLHQTVDDFWRMVWEQKISMIVMLTQCVERGKTKCEQYWPTEDEYVYHADLKVQKKSVSILPEYTIRIFDLILGTRERTVNQMHFTRWPDFGCPESPEELINFVKAVRAHLSHTNNGPILVHCSAGVGRTGTFIAVDRLSQYIQYHNFVDVYGTVIDMRDHRVNMVQTENQYIYIHKCVKQLILEKLKISSSNEKLTDDVCSNVDLKASIQSA